MADFASGLFLHSPVPTIVVCHCKIIIAANLAVQQLLGTTELPSGHGGRVCGVNCLAGDGIDKFDFAIEGQEQSWDSVLERVNDPSLRAAKEVAGFGIKEAFIRCTRPKNSTMARHDSPVEDTFPKESDNAAQHIIEDQYHADVVETVRAKVSINAWDYHGEAHYILSFQDTHVIQTVPGGKEPDQIDVQDHWLKRCRHAIFDSVPLLGYLIDPQGNFIYLNKLTSTLSGGVKIRNIATGEDASPLWTEDFSRKLKHSELPGVQMLRTRAELPPFKYGQIDPQTNKRYQLRGWGNCLYDADDGEFLGAVLFSEVLGEYEALIEKANMEHLKSFEKICNDLPHYLWTADENGFGEWFSSQWLEYTGLEPESCKGWGWKQTLHPDDVDRFTEAFRNAHDQAVNYEIEARCKRHDGVYRWMLKRGAPIKDDNGKVILWTGTNTEIHETVMARIKARHERDQIVKAMQHAQVNVWAVTKNPRQLSMIEGSVIRNHQSKDDSEGDWLHPTEEQIIEYTRGKIQGTDELDQAVQAVLDGEIDKAEIEVKWMDRWHKVWIIPDFADGTTQGVARGEVIGVVGCSIDISDEKMRSVLESDNKQLSEEKHLAKEQSRMKSKFLANMSHEIRTPVAGVIGLANLLLDSNLDDEQRDHAEAIQMSAQTLLMIVNDILDFSKVESGKLTLENIEFNLATLVTNLWKVMHYSAQQKSIDFTCIINFPSDLTLYGDPGRIRQILTNLVSNAIKFTQHGTVKLSVTTISSRKGERIVFAVEDSGIGIKKEILANLFRPFQQGDSSTARLFGGSGLGLSISRSLASLMKGHIELDSRPEIGTTATFSIPMEAVNPPSDLLTAEGPRCLLPHHSRPKSLHTSHTAPPPGRRPSQINRRTKSYNDRRGDTLAAEERAVRDALRQQLTPEQRARTHVLLAEDNAVNRLIAIRAIEKLGFTVSAVWNGKEALEYLIAPSSETHKQASLVLMDCQMPVMDGYCATRKVRNEEPYRSMERLRGLPIVAMTASAIQGDREKCFDAGMSDYLAKPVEAGALEAMLVKWTLSARKGSVVGWREGMGDYFGEAFYSQWT